MKAKYRRMFIKEFDKWVKKLGLHDWDIIHSIDPPGNSDSFASCWSESSSRIATIYLVDVWPEYYITKEMREERIKNAALHEVLELLMTDIDTLAKSRDWNGQEWEGIRHAAIERLIKGLK